MGISEGILTALVFLLIPGLANSLPVYARRFDFLNYPVDGGIKLGGKRLLGPGKTWRGFFFGVVGSGLVFASIVWFLFPGVLELVPNLEGLPPLKYFSYTALVSLGALFGDSVKSFFKRRVGRERGESWFVFDQVDWVIGCTSVYVLFFGWESFLWYTPLLGILGHLLVKYTSYLMKIDNKPI